MAVTANADTRAARNGSELIPVWFSNPSLTEFGTSSKVALIPLATAPPSMIVSSIRNEIHYAESAPGFGT